MVCYIQALVSPNTRFILRFAAGSGWGLFHLGIEWFDQEGHMPAGSAEIEF